MVQKPMHLMHCLEKYKCRFFIGAQNNGKYTTEHLFIPQKPANCATTIQVYITTHFLLLLTHVLMFVLDCNGLYSYKRTPNREWLVLDQHSSEYGSSQDFFLVLSYEVQFLIAEISHHANKRKSKIKFNFSINNPHF